MGELIGSLFLCCFVYMAPVGCFFLPFQPPLYHIWVGGVYGEVHPNKFLYLYHRCDVAVVRAPQAAIECPVEAFLLH